MPLYRLVGGARGAEESFEELIVVFAGHPHAVGDLNHAHVRVVRGPHADMPARLRDFKAFEMRLSMTWQSRARSA